MQIVRELVEEFRAGLEAEREVAVNAFAGKLVEFVGDGRLSDEEVAAACNWADDLQITQDEWEALRETVYAAAVAAGAAASELSGIRAFLFFSPEQ